MAADDAEQKHVISCLVENKAGVLAHIASLFSARGFNIDSLAVGETEDDTLSRMTIVVRGSEATLEQVRKQLEKVVDVIQVMDLSGLNYVERDLTLVKVAAPPGKRTEIFELVEVFRGKIVDISKQDLMIELSGPEQKIQALIELLRPYGIKEMARTGRVAMKRG